MTQAEHSESFRQCHAEIRFSKKKSAKPSSGAGPELAAALAAKDTIR